MKALWRRDQFLKPPRFKNPWKDSQGRLYIFVRVTEKSNWALLQSDQWDEGDILCHIRVGKERQLPDEGDVIVVKRGETEFKFSVRKIFREVGRRRSKPMAVTPM